MTVIYHLYDTPTFKTKALCLASNVWLLKRLLLYYKQLTQCYFTLLWLSNDATNQMTPLIWGIQAHTHTCTHTYTRTYHFEIDLKKPGMCWLQASVRLV